MEKDSNFEEFKNRANRVWNETQCEESLNVSFKNGTDDRLRDFIEKDEDENMSGYDILLENLVESGYIEQKS